jgi:hypothetical protein
VRRSGPGQRVCRRGSGILGPAPFALGRRASNVSHREQLRRGKRDGPGPKTGETSSHPEPPHAIHPPHYGDLSTKKMAPRARLSRRAEECDPGAMRSLATGALLVHPNGGPSWVAPAAGSSFGSRYIRDDPDLRSRSGSGEVWRSGPGRRAAEGPTLEAGLCPGSESSIGRLILRAQSGISLRRPSLRSHGRGRGW